MGKTSMLGTPAGGASRLKYSCKVCDTKPRGCDIAKHYDYNTNWPLLSEMKSCVGDAAFAELRKKADPHTIFMFDHKYRKNFLPSWKTHAQWKEKEDTEMEEEQEDSSSGAPPLKKSRDGSSSSIMNYFNPADKRMDTDTNVEGEEEEREEEEHGDRDENVIIDTQVIDEVQDEDNYEENLLNVTEAEKDPENEEHGLAGSRTASNISRTASNRSRRSSRSASRGSGGGRRSRSASGGRRSTVDLTEASMETLAEKIARRLLRLQEEKKLEMRKRRPLMMVGKLDQISSRVKRVPLIQIIQMFPNSSPDRRNVHLESSAGIMSKEKAGQNIK